MILHAVITNRVRRTGLLLSGLLLLFLASCEMDDGDLVRMSELGTVGTIFELEAIGGDTAVQVYSNERYSIYFLEEYDWAKLLQTEMTGDGEFIFSYNDNLHFPRMAKVCLFAPESDRRDTLIFRQKGTMEVRMTFKESSTTVLGDGGVILSEIDTNVDSKNIFVTVSYSGEEGQDWVNNDFEFNNGVLSFSVKPNPSETELRNAQVKLTYVDGWEQKIVSTLYILQANALNLFGEEASFTDIRLWAGDKITSNLYIEGYVISDAGNPNVGDCPQTTSTSLNYTVNDKTVYIQSADGKYGFRLLTTTVEDNIFKRYSKVQILLKGTNVYKETDPDRYYITGITSDMVMTSVLGTANDIPKKEKYMSELTDDDIYTYVTLKDCEFPIRKGSFTPVNEGYTVLYNSHRLSKYPLLMRDIQGNSMVLYTNTKCPYRRDGSMLPYGSGTVSGIIVHETFTRFEYEDTDSEDTYGNIGRYQIRHLTREEIKLQADFENGFSALLTEYRYPKIENGIQYPTTGANGLLRVSAENVDITSSSDFTYLGLCGSANLGNTNPLGNGVIENGVKVNTASGTNSDGKGATSSSSFNCSCLWWNTVLDRGEAWILEVSTAGISTDQLSLQFTAYNWASSGAGTPRFWKVEWSTHGNMEGNWDYIASYTVPDASNWSNTLMHQLPAFKNINIPLPLTMLGKEKVYIRLIVEKNLCSSGTTYATDPISKALGNSIGYLAIRYNKP